MWGSLQHQNSRARVDTGKASKVLRTFLPLLVLSSFPPPLQQASLVALFLNEAGSRASQQADQCRRKLACLAEHYYFVLAPQTSRSMRFTLQL